MPASDPPKPAAKGSPRKQRETPWSVFIVAGIFFAIGLWLYLDVRREVKELEEAKARAPAASSAKPKILGLDVIPQLAESNEAKVRTAPSAAPSAAASASAMPAPAASPAGSAAR